MPFLMRKFSSFTALDAFKKEGGKFNVTWISEYIVSTIQVLIAMYRCLKFEIDKICEE